MEEPATYPLPARKNRQNRNLGAMRRTKGQRGELEFCKELSEHLGEAINRQLGSARDGGPDVLIGGRWAVEVKRCERPLLEAWWNQAVRQAAEIGFFPALAYRQSCQPWRVIVHLDVVMFGQHQWIPRWMDDTDMNWIATLSLPGFAALIREVNSPHD